MWQGDTKPKAVAAIKAHEAGPKVELCKLPAGPAGVRALPMPVQLKLQEVVAVQAQQFRGYVFSADTHHGREGRFCLAFEAAMDAVRFCHAAQV